MGPTEGREQVSLLLLFHSVAAPPLVPTVVFLAGVPSLAAFASGSPALAFAAGPSNGATFAAGSAAPVLAAGPPPDDEFGAGR